MKESVGQKDNLKKLSQSVRVVKKKKKKGKEEGNEEKKKIKLNSYKDVNEILDIIENSKMDSKSRLFEQHFRNIRTRRSIDFGKEKCYEKNKDTHKHEFKLIEKSERKNPFTFKMHKVNPFLRNLHKKDLLFRLE